MKTKKMKKMKKKRKQKHSGNSERHPMRTITPKGVLNQRVHTEKMVENQF